MKDVKLIGITGYKGSGKSSFAASLSAKYACVISPLKAAALQMVTALPSRIRFTESGELDRLVDSLYRWGRVENGLDYWPNVWTYRSGYDKVLVDDVEHVSDAEFIRENGGVIVRVYRPETDSLIDWRNLTPAEREITNIEHDISVFNTGDPEFLADQAIALAGDWGWEAPQINPTTAPGTFGVFPAPNPTGISLQQLTNLLVQQQGNQIYHSPNPYAALGQAGAPSLTTQPALPHGAGQSGRRP